MLLDSTLILAHRFLHLCCFENWHCVYLDCSWSDEHTFAVLGCRFKLDDTFKWQTWQDHLRKCKLLVD